MQYNCIVWLLSALLPLHMQVGKFGKPTWRRLVEAVEDKVGGNNPALAENITREHPAAPGKHILSK